MPSDAPPLGSARLAWTEPWVRAREWFASTFDGVPVERSIDPAGNLWVTLPGARPERIVLGSHLDSVPNGGWLDGASACWPGPRCCGDCTATASSYRCR